ncbi:MAG: energy transducer TonB [Acidobacteriota bacterium]|nr:energy transducer TonB [Acidobacteriota bacterium]
MAHDAQRPATERRPHDEDAGYLAFALEDEEDARRTRYAVAGAVLVHAALFAAPLGFLKPDRAAAEPPRQTVFVVRQLRFEPPALEPQRELPTETRRRVPIPDPTPDDPEPLRLEETIAQDLDLPDVDLVLGIPDAPPPLAPDGPIPVGGAVARPLKVSGPRPQYTEIARKARIEGVVIVQAIIDETGDVTNVKVLKPLPMGLDQAAVDAISQWKFEPATLNGKPVAVYYSLTVNFRLRQ